ncbi:hypothetical protein, partial [Staphylococcus aureus]|uniref:hypothetical protein n=1 Tax=Staphylococcus aureus TaxID=1280 RepID=UPI0038B33052
PETDNENSDGALEPTSERGAPQRVGGFRYHRHGDRWQWSGAVARIHGYTPGTVTPTTELILSHKPPDDRPHLDAIRTAGGP